MFPGVIAIAGLKGSGKNTAADLIIDLYKDKLNFETIAFADPIRKEVERIFKLDGSNKQYDSFKRSTMSFGIGFIGNSTIYARRAVREIGMLMRSYDEDQFVRYVNEKIQSDKAKVWIITDLRFQNELDFLKSINAYIIKVDREVVKDDHITEAGIYDSHCNAVFDNNKSEGDLKLQIKLHFDNLL